VISIIIGILDFFVVYLYYVDNRFLLAIVWAIIGTLNLMIGVMMSEWR